MAFDEQQEGVNADELSKSRTGNPRSIQQRTDSESDISSPLPQIPTCCKNLRILDITKCKKLTDTGIEWLVPKTAELSKTLLELMVGCQAVTKRGIIFAVQNCPSLEVVENINMFDALVELARSSALAQPSILNTNITRLTLRPADVYISGQLELVVRFCPSKG
ncbi:hypothetical protein DAPPUDRAFT_239900 [Daphnia pulex]|uniref:Uncharacterized protein n=1 Tax=Daphnia pulex TaxID=6669 RepID=E9GAD6_DAPPU|nr:hypothetical protein DAPPUDRAFT_239900 [Daphnia pulex]|eukprot:EFX83727.1 hypothetical protein DAPPUDRAFT_239900 [Daphnia pulex]